MATNNDGNVLDTSGNVQVDYVWGNFPAQPNDVRVASPSQTVTVGGDQNVSWTNYGTIKSGYLDFTKDSHAIQEAGWSGYPGFTASGANYIVTAVSANGTTITYTSQNNFNGGEVVNITGLTTSAYNLSGATVVSANATSFTVTNSAVAGLLTGQYGKVQSTTALSVADGAFISGVAYVKVPSVLGLTTALAQDALADAELTVTTASAATNTAKTVTDINRTSGSTNLVFTASGAGAAYGVGTKVTVSGFSNSDAFLNGTYTVTANATNTFTVVTTATDAVALTGKAGSVVGVTGTITTQSIAAGASSIAPAAAITITPWA